MPVRTVIVRSGADLGTAVAEARRARGMTQVQAAAAAGLDRSYLAKIESGLTVVLLERVLRVLRRLGAQVVVELPDPAPAESRESTPDEVARADGRGR